MGKSVQRYIFPSACRQIRRIEENDAERNKGHYLEVRSIYAGAAERRMSMSFANLPVGEIKDYPPYLDRPKNIKPQTNADRIRAMGDEGLAEWLNSMYIHDCDCCIHQMPCRFEYDTETMDYTEKYNCREGILAWLQQPAEEVHHE